MKVWHAIIPAYLALCFLLGGASAAGQTANIVLQLTAILLLVLSVGSKRQAALPAEARQVVAMLLLLVALFVVQLVPLPPALWTELPGREEVASGFRLLGLPLPWLPLSLAPDRTLVAFVWLLPAAAVLIGIVQLGAFRPSWIAATFVGAMVLSVLVGAIQVAGGAGSPAYFYRITNYGVAVGFFANANHMATLLVVSLPFVAALQATALRRRRSRGRASGLMALSVIALLVVLVGLLINNSLAGLGLVVPAAAASFLIVRGRRQRLPIWMFGVVALLGVAAVGVVLTAPLGNNLSSAAAADISDSRRISFAHTLDAAQDYLPFGSGLGTFVDIYRTKEDPAAVGPTFMNHAHNDYFEIALEAGIPGLIMVALFLLWWARRTIGIWRDAEPDPFAQAATIASAVIILHSVVDYPLRTAAISALFAACVALMVKPRPKGASRSASEESGRHLSAD